MESILRKAMLSGASVVIMYYSKKGIVTKRTISVENTKGEWVEGFCYLRQAYRRFHKGNILAVLPAEKGQLDQHDSVN